MTVRALSFVLLIAASGFANAANIVFQGPLRVVDLEDPAAIYFGTAIDHVFNGAIDDTTFNGFISDGNQPTSFTCCEAAEGITLINNLVLSQDDADFLNAILGTTTFSANTSIDQVDVEGDGVSPSGGRIEVGLSYILDAASFDNEDPGNYPFDSVDVLATLFFIVEDNALGDEIYNVVGLVTPVPLPAGIVLFSGALFSLGFCRRSKH